MPDLGTSEYLFSIVGDPALCYLFEQNVKKAEDAGLDWGAYLYSYALTEAEAKSEVAHTLRLLKGKKPVSIWKYFVSAICAPLLNTLFFMGYICLFLYQTEMVQNLVAKTGALNPFMFVILLVGVQGLVEAGVCCFIGGAVSKAAAKAVLKE